MKSTINTLLAKDQPVSPSWVEGVIDRIHGVAFPSETLGSKIFAELGGKNVSRADILNSIKKHGNTLQGAAAYPIFLQGLYLGLQNNKNFGCPFIGDRMEVVSFGSNSNGTYEVFEDYELEGY
jgi:hypothetical protein|tara:strand:+ start:484 stop:852 length:369 start_codon:yes stop_codon:yes gene_type:complete